MYSRKGHDMSNPEYLTQLLDEAKAKAGSDNKLAGMLAVSRQTVSDWRKGRKPIPPEDRAQLAEIAGYDAIQELCRAHIDKHQGTKKGATLSRILGKLARVTGEGASSLTAGLALFFSHEQMYSFTRCIERLSGREALQPSF